MGPQHRRKGTETYPGETRMTPGKKLLITAAVAIAAGAIIIALWSLSSPRESPTQRKARRLWAELRPGPMVCGLRRGALRFWGKSTGAGNGDRHLRPGAPGLRSQSPFPGDKLNLLRHSNAILSRECYNGQ